LGASQDVEHPANSQITTKPSRWRAFSSMLTMGKWSDEFSGIVSDVSHSYIEGIVRGYRNSLLTSQNYNNMTQCETIDGGSFYIILMTERY
jgi:hypothetical protein